MIRDENPQDEFHLNSDKGEWKVITRDQFYHAPRRQKWFLVGVRYISENHHIGDLMPENLRNVEPENDLSL